MSHADGWGPTRSLYRFAAGAWGVALVGHGALLAGSEPGAATWWLPWIGVAVGLLLASGGHVAFAVPLRRVEPAHATVALSAGVVATVAGIGWLVDSVAAGLRAALPGVTGASLAAVAIFAFLVATFALGVAAWHSGGRERAAGLLLAGWPLVVLGLVVLAAALGVGGAWVAGAVFAVCALVLATVASRLTTRRRAAAA